MDWAKRRTSVRIPHGAARGSGCGNPPGAPENPPSIDPDRFPYDFFAKIEHIIEDGCARPGKRQSRKSEYGRPTVHHPDGVLLSGMLGVRQSMRPALD